jgi:hypothetical protein
MKEENDRLNPPFRAEAIDLSKLSVDELDELRKAILARARKMVDPLSTGFNPIMMATTPGEGIFSTDDVAIDWRDWWERFADIGDIVAISFRRLSLALIAAGGAIASSHMLANSDSARFGVGTLAVSAALGAWFVIDMVRTGSTKR